MLGHKVLGVLSAKHETWGTTRPAAAPLLARCGVPDERLVLTAGLPTGPELETILQRVGPDLVVNCIGAVKQVAAAQDPVAAITVNSLFPHQVALACSGAGARLLHISTDCVFSGASGGYSEAAVPDATDLYGRSKLLGEVVHEPHLTLRTSIVGRELAGAHGLVEWFLGERGGAVRGFRSAYFSGLTTLELARIIELVATDHRDLVGLFHVASARIDKDTLLRMVGEAFGTGTRIVPDDSVLIDRSLDGELFHRATGIAVPEWRRMIDDMAHDSEHVGYDQLRSAPTH